MIKLSLGIKLKAVHDYFIEQINSILEVTKDLYGILREEYRQLQEQLNREENRKKYQEYISIIKQLNKSADGTSIYLSDEHQEIHNLQTRLNSSVPKLNHLLNMTLVYSVAFFEGFDKRFFSTLFFHKPEMMKSNRRITYKELLNFDSINALHKNIAKNITENYGYMDIDEFNEEISFKFNFSLNKEFEEWEGLREIYYRRNIIIHNRSTISKIYLKKMNHPPESLNKLALIDINYVKSANEIIIKYIQFIFKKIIKKFNLNTSVKRFAPFPPQFDKPMIVKRGKDEIFND